MTYQCLGPVISLRGQCLSQTYHQSGQGSAEAPPQSKKEVTEERQGEAERRRYPLLGFNDGSLREGLLPETCHPFYSQGSAQE